MSSGHIKQKGLSEHLFIWGHLQWSPSQCKTCPSTHLLLLEPSTHSFHLPLPNSLNVSTSCQVYFLIQCWTISFLSFLTVKVSSFISQINVVTSELLPFIHSLPLKSILHPPANVVLKQKSDHTPPLLRELLRLLVIALKMKAKHLNMIWRERISKSGKRTRILQYFSNSEKKN